MASNDTEFDVITPSELEIADAVEQSDILFVLCSDGKVKRASRRAVELDLQLQLNAETLIRTEEHDEIWETFSEFRKVSSAPTVSEAEERVLYLVNTVRNVYQGFYLFIDPETQERSIGQIGGRTYTGINGITVDDEEATISNDLVTDGGTIEGDLTVDADLEVTGELTVDDNAEIAGDLTVNGNIYQHGESYETHAEKLYTKNDMVITRDGAESELNAGEYTGIKAKHYDVSGNDGLLAFDRTGTARVGDYKEITVYSDDGETFYTDSEMTVPAVIPDGITPSATSEENVYEYVVDDTQALATREDTPVNSALMKWNSITKRLESSSLSEASIGGEFNRIDGIIANDHSKNVSMYDTTLPAVVTDTVRVEVGERAYVASTCKWYKCTAVNPETKAVTWTEFEPEISCGVKYVDELPQSGILNTVYGYRRKITYTGTVQNMISQFNSAFLITDDDDDGPDRIITYSAVNGVTVFVTQDNIKTAVTQIVLKYNEDDGWSVISPSNLDVSTSYNWLEEFDPVYSVGDKEKQTLNSISSGSGSGGSGTVVKFETKAEAITALNLPEGVSGYIPNNAIVIIEEENAYITGEEQ